MYRRRTEWRYHQNQAGLTLLEVLLAAVILGLAAVSVFNLLVVTRQLQTDARQHMEALRTAESVLESYKARPYSDIARPGEELDDQVVVAVAERAGLKVVTVTVFYPAGEGVKSVSLTLERGPR